MCGKTRIGTLHFEPGGQRFESVRARDFHKNYCRSSTSAIRQQPIRTADRQQGEFDNSAVCGRIDRPQGDRGGVRRVLRRIIRPGAQMFFGLQLNDAHKSQLSILDDVLIACRQCHTPCPCGRDQEAVRWIAVRLTR
jgi:hypothetical protein